MKIYIDKTPTVGLPKNVTEAEDEVITFKVHTPIGPYRIVSDFLCTKIFFCGVEIGRGLMDIDFAMKEVQSDYNRRRFGSFVEVEIELGPGVYGAKEHMVDFENGYEEALQDIRWPIQDALGMERT